MDEFEKNKTILYNEILKDKLTYHEAIEKYNKLMDSVPYDMLINTRGSRN